MDTLTTNERRPFMDCFYALADVDDATRHDAVVDLLHYMSTKKHQQADYKNNVGYTIKRLVRGLGSSRGCARQGFSLGLTELLRLTKKKSTTEHVVTDVQQVIDMIATEHTVSGQKGQEERDLLLGLVTGVSCVVRSGRIHHRAPDTSRVLRMVLEVAEKKVWIQQMCYETVALILGTESNEEVAEAEHSTQNDAIIFEEDTLALFIARLMPASVRKKHVVAATATATATATEVVTGAASDSSSDSSSSDDDSSDSDDEGDTVMGTVAVVTAKTFDVSLCDPQQLQLALILHRWCQQHHIAATDARLGPLSPLATGTTFDNLAHLAAPLRESARFATGIHAVWGHVVRRCATPSSSTPSSSTTSSSTTSSSSTSSSSTSSSSTPSSSVLRLWNEVVCHPQHGLLNTTHQRRVLAFRLFQFIFRSHETITTIDRASLLHNQLFVKSLAAHICQTDSHLHRPAMRIVSCIKAVAEESMAMRMAIVGILMSTDPMFDVHSAIRKKKKHRRGAKKVNVPCFSIFLFF